MTKYKNFKEAFREKKNDALPLKEVLQVFLKSNHVEKKYQHANIAKNWQHIVGVPIAVRTTEIFARGNKLYVKISSAPLRQELLMGREKILKMVHAFIGEEVFKEIVFL